MRPTAPSHEGDSVGDMMPTKLEIGALDIAVAAALGTGKGWALNVLGRAEEARIMRRTIDGLLAAEQSPPQRAEILQIDRPLGRVAAAAHRTHGDRREATWLLSAVGQLHKLHRLPTTASRSVPLTSEPSWSPVGPQYVPVDEPDRLGAPVAGAAGLTLGIRPGSIRFGWRTSQLER